MQDRDDLRDLSGFLRRRARIIIGFAVLTAVAAYVLSTLAPERYRATARVLFSDQSAAATAGDPTRAVDTFVQLAKTEQVLAPVAKARGFSSTEALRRTLDVKADVNTNVIGITATAPTARAAAARANAVASRLVSWRNASRNDQARARIRFYRQQVAALGSDSAAAVAGADLRAQLAEARSQLAIPNPELQLVSAANVPRAKASPLPVRNAVIGLLAGLVLGLLVAAARERLDRRIHGLDRLRRVYRWPVLGLIPATRRTRSSGLANFSGTSALASAYRATRTNLGLVDRSAGHERDRTRGRVYLVTSACPDEGKTAVVANLASAFAGAGQRVLAVCADLLHPSLHEQFGLDGQRSRGLVDVLAGETPLTEAVRTAHVAQLGRGGGVLGVVASTRSFADPAVLFESRAMADFLDIVRSGFDVVLIEASPLLGAGDTASLAPQTDGVVLVAALDRLELGPADRASALLDTLGIRPLGVVVTGYDGDDSETASTYRAPETAPVRRQSAAQPQRV